MQLLLSLLLLLLFLLLILLLLILLQDIETTMHSQSGYLGHASMSATSQSRFDSNHK